MSDTSWGATMGMSDKFDEMKDKATDAMGEHGDKAKEGMQSAADKADEKTGGKYGDQIDKGMDAASDKVDGMGDSTIRATSEYRAGSGRDPSRSPAHRVRFRHARATVQLVARRSGGPLPRVAPSAAAFRGGRRVFPAFGRLRPATARTRGNRRHVSADRPAHR